MKATEHLAPSTLTGKKITHLSITRWGQYKKGKNYNTCEKGVVSASDFRFQLSSMVLLFFIVYVLPHISYITNESILGSQRLGTI